MSDSDLEFAPLAVELFVPNVAETVAFYTDKLGFHLVRAEPEGATTFTFALTALDSAVFMFMEEAFYSGADRPLRSERGDGVDIRVMVPDVDAMHQRVIESGLTITHDIADRDYGLRDFIARDPWGFRLRFASPLAWGTMGDDLDTLRARMMEAATWYRAAQSDPHSTFPRTRAFAPDPFAGRPQQVVASVTMLRNYKVQSMPPAPDVATEGRLLRYSRDESLDDGAAEVYTKGFFDTYNAPPWDLWIGYVVESHQEYLVTWIPTSLVEIVSVGIDVNPEQCIDWLDDLEQSLGLR